MSNALAKICTGVGVQIIERGAMFAPGQTNARDMLADIFRKHGEAHLVMLLRVFVDSSPENAVEMHEPVLEAVSEIMRAQPSWVASGLRWLEAFDSIDLGVIYRETKAIRWLAAQRAGIITLVYRELRRTFDNVVSIAPSPAPARNRTMPIENDLLFGPRAIAKFLEMSTDQCRPMIADGSIPTFAIPGSNARCARKSTLNALWGQCEAESRRSGGAL
jgi:hypothetical protein